MTFKTRLSKLLHYMRDQLLTFPDHLTGEERNAVGEPDAWSAKDEIVHINVWANRALDNLEIIEHGDTPPDRDYGDYVEENRAIFEDHQAISWEEAQALVRDGYARAGAFIARTDEESLLSIPDWQDRPLWRAIASNFITHPMIHLWDYYRRHGYDDLLNAPFGEQFTARLVDLSDDDGWRGTTYYNLACIFALSGQKEEAISALAQALSLAPELVEWSRQDSDLDALRDDPAFQALYGDQ